MKTAMKNIRYCTFSTAQVETKTPGHIGVPLMIFTFLTKEADATSAIPESMSYPCLSDNLAGVFRSKAGKQCRGCRNRL